MDDLLAFKHIFNKYDGLKNKVLNSFIGDLNAAEIVLKLNDNNIITITPEYIKKCINCTSIVGFDSLKKLTNDELIRIWDLYVGEFESDNYIGLLTKARQIFDAMPSFKEKYTIIYEKFLAHDKYYFPSNVEDKNGLIENLRNSVTLYPGKKLSPKEQLIYILDDTLDTIYDLVGMCNWIGNDLNYQLLSKISIEKIYNLFHYSVYNVIRFFIRCCKNDALTKEDFFQYIERIFSRENLSPDCLSIEEYIEILNLFPDIIEFNKNFEWAFCNKYRSSSYIYNLNYHNFDFLNYINKDSVIFKMLYREIDRRKGIYLTLSIIEKSFKHISLFYNGIIKIENCVSDLRDIAKVVAVASKNGVKLSQSSIMFDNIKYRRKSFITFMNYLNDMLDNYGVNERLIVNFAIMNKEINSVDKTKLCTDKYIQKYNSFILGEII